MAVFRVVSRLQSPIKGYVRTMFDYAISDLLLSDLDVMSQDKRYLTKITEEEFSEMDNASWVPITSGIDKYYKRICTIVPLYVDKSSMVVPIPCIIDTGAPTFMILGEGATVALQRYNIIPRGEITMIVKGTMIKNGYRVTNPVVSQLPDHLYSTPDARKDVRLNVLGLKALQDFQFVLNFQSNFLN